MQSVLGPLGPCSSLAVQSAAIGAHVLVGDLLFLLLVRDLVALLVDRDGHTDVPADMRGRHLARADVDILGALAFAMAQPGQDLDRVFGRATAKPGPRRAGGLHVVVTG